MPPATDNPFANRNGKPGSAADPKPTPDPNLERRLAGLESSLERALQGIAQLTQVVQIQAQQQGQRPTQPVTSPDPNPEDDLAGLNANPRAWAREIARREAEAAGGSYQRMTFEMAAAVGDNLLDNERVKIESKYGSEAWGKLIAPAIQPFLDNLRQSNPLGLAKKETIGKLISMAVGEHIEPLLEMRSAFEKLETDAVTAAKESLVSDLRSQLPNPGLVRRRRDNQSATEEIPGLDVMIKEHAALGEKIDPEEFAKWHNVGNSLDDVLPLLETSEK